ncbi:MAG TPA: sugar phosphate isomerase/epimerase family protein [archaeon]|nr:sugar phosphate isomerase/epimerase family protein [archaeon]
MTTFGNLTNPMNDIVEEIKTIKKLGCDFVEIAIEGPYNLPEILEVRKTKIKKALKIFNHPPVAHFAWWAELGSPMEDVRRGWIEETKRGMRIAKALGAKKFAVHSHSKGMYARSEKTLKPILNNYVRSLRELVAFGNKIGIQIMLENAAERGEIVHFKNFKYIVDRVPKLAVHIDVGHAFINGGMKTVEDFIGYFQDKTIHFHIHDNHSKDDEHLSIGNGKINYEKVVKLIKKTNYSNTITFEVFEPPRSNVAKSLTKIKRLFA